jgi:hypothetical protein
MLRTCTFLDAIARTGRRALLQSVAQVATALLSNDIADFAREIIARIDQLGSAKGTTRSEQLDTLRCTDGLTKWFFVI